METTARDCNTKVTPAHLCVKTQLKPRNRIRPLETIRVTQKTDTSHHKYTLTPVWCQRPPRGEVSKRGRDSGWVWRSEIQVEEVGGCLLVTGRLVRLPHSHFYSETR